jgi:hypothetical protein
MKPAASANPRRSARTTKRIPVNVTIKIQGKEQVLMVNTVGISRHGFRVQTSLPLERGQPVYATPRAPNAPSGYGRVVWIGDGEAGLELLN